MCKGDMSSTKQVNREKGTTEGSCNNPCGHDPKIIDLLQQRDGQEPFTSLEFFPPRTDMGVKNLGARLDRMKNNVKPLFTDITWGAGGSTAGLSMDIALQMHNTGHVANLHLTCTNMSKEGDSDPLAAVRDALRTAYDGGIRNIVALRGDPPAGESSWTASEGGFTCALDLVKFIRSEFGDEFGIAVAGYPEGHPDAITDLESDEEVSKMTDAEKGRCSVLDGVTRVCKDEDYEKEMVYLKEKVDAGADIIITQMFFDTEVYKTFVHDCRSYGINCPIIPGLMCINAVAGFNKMTRFCKTRVTPALRQKMDELADDPDAVKEFGVEFGTSMCRDLLKSGLTLGLHFYTLNLEKVVYGIAERLGMLSTEVETNESDAATMVAVGSAWAREGDTVKTLYGNGVVSEVRDDGVAKIEMKDWVLAGGQKPAAYLRKEHYEKVF